jgi:hypothetical protein
MGRPLLPNPGATQDPARRSDVVRHGAESQLATQHN